MNTVGQAFRNNRMANGARLGGVAWVNQSDSPPGAFSLVGDVLYQLVPGSVTDALIHAAIVPSLHVLDVQIFKGNDLIGMDNLATQLVGKVSTLVGYALVDVLYHPPVLAPFSRALSALRQAPLRRMDLRHLVLEQTKTPG